MKLDIERILFYSYLIFPSFFFNTEILIFFFQYHRHCGYPHRLLLPKGTTQGMAFNLYVTITNYEQDKVSSCNRRRLFFGFSSQHLLNDIASIIPIC